MSCQVVTGTETVLVVFFCVVKSMDAMITIAL